LKALFKLPGTVQGYPPPEQFQRDDMRDRLDLQSRDNCEVESIR